MFNDVTSTKNEQKNNGVILEAKYLPLFIAPLIVLASAILRDRILFFLTQIAFFVMYYKPLQILSNEINNKDVFEHYKKALYSIGAMIILLVLMMALVGSSVIDILGSLGGSRFNLTHGSGGKFALFIIFVIAFAAAFVFQGISLKNMFSILGVKLGNSLLIYGSYSLLAYYILTITIVLSKFATLASLVAWMLLTFGMYHVVKKE